MNVVQTVYARVFQTIMRLAAYFLNFKRPTTIETDRSGRAVVDIAKKRALTRFLLVTDPGIARLKLHESLVNEVTSADYRIVIYDRTMANPTIDNIEEALELYRINGCQAIIALGGGSAIDCAKGVHARLARPKKTITQMRGLLKVGCRRSVLIAVPTTAGTGSEATLAAVITDARTHEKYAINDPHLIPDYAILDVGLTYGLPPHITAATGMDALTHAVEAYIGQANTKGTRRAALKAITLIHEFLYQAYLNPQDTDARMNMQRAALEAGVAFTRAYVGHVHSLAHQLGGYYQVPHGLANAVILPIVLDEYGVHAEKKLAQLADHLSLTSKNAGRSAKARAFGAYVRDLNVKMKLTNEFGHLIKDEDIPTLARRAYQEAFPLYPVPELWPASRYQAIYKRLQKEP
jgi:alcohol dehydrogenase class IV